MANKHISKINVLVKSHLHKLYKHTKKHLYDIEAQHKKHMVEWRHQDKHHLANKEILYQKHKSYLASKSNQHEEYSDDYGPNNDGETVVTITYNVDVYGPVDNNRDSVSKGYNNNGGDDYVENRHIAGE